MIKKLLSIIVALLIATSAACAVLVTAAGKSVSFSFAAYEYSTEQKRMIAKTDFKPNETVYLQVSVSEISGIGGFTLNITFDNSLFTFDKSAVVYLIDDKKSDYVASNTSKGMLFAWETTSVNTTLSGILFYLPFKVNGDITGSVEGVFKPSLTEVFESDSGQTGIKANVSGNVSVNVVAASLPEDFLNLVRGLENISYNPNNDPQRPVDSLASINNALTQYSALAADQKSAFYNNYPELYNILSNAKNRYYELAESESKKLITEELNNFLNNHSQLLNKDISSLTLDSDGENLANLKSDYAILSTAAKKAMTEADKTKVTEFISKYDRLVDEKEASEAAAAEVAEFRESYGMFLSDENYPKILADWAVTYSTYFPYITEADVVYSILSEEAQTILSTEKQRIDKLTELASEYLKNDEATEVLLEKVSDFQKSYIEVFALNAGNVSLKDKTAIEMVLESYKRIEDPEVKEKLKNRIAQLENLLSVIDELETVEEIENTSDTVADNSNGQSQNGQTVQTVTKTNTVTKLVDKLFKVNSGFRTPFIILIVMLVLSVCCLAASAVISQKFTEKTLAAKEEDL